MSEQDTSAYDVSISETSTTSLKELTEDTQVLSDGREKLLDYIWREITTTLRNNWRLHDPNFWYANIKSWLDRQAAITAEETSGAWEEYRDATQREIAELTAERDLWIKRYQQAHEYALELTVEKTCRIVAHVTDGMMTGFPRRLFEFSCGHSVMLVGLVEEPNCCSICGAKVVRR